MRSRAGSALENKRFDTSAGELRYHPSMRSRSLMVVALSAIVGACDSDVLFGGGSGGAGGVTSAGGTGAGPVTTSSTGGARPETCPAEEPNDGDPCMKKGMRCEYGDGPI